MDLKALLAMWQAPKPQVALVRGSPDVVVYKVMTSLQYHELQTVLAVQAKVLDPDLPHSRVDWYYWNFPVNQCLGNNWRCHPGRSDAHCSSEKQWQIEGILEQGALRRQSHGTKEICCFLILISCAHQMPSELGLSSLVRAANKRGEIGNACLVGSLWIFMGSIGQQ